MEDEKDLKIAFHLPKNITADYQGMGIQTDYGKLAVYRDLTFRAQFQPDTYEGKPYGNSLEYRDCGGIGLREIERIGKMLKRIDKIEKSFPVAPESFGQYVQLVCMGLKIDLAVKDGIGNGWHTETEHTTWKVSEIQWLVDEPEESEPEEDADEPNEDDIITRDDRTFYQYGKKVLEIDEDEDREEALVMYMNRTQFWPDCWTISDHGNSCRIDLQAAYDAVGTTTEKPKPETEDEEGGAK